MKYKLNFDVNKVHTPAFVVDEKLLIKNLEILERVKKETGAKILLAQKAFSMYSTYPLIGKYLDGTTASGLFEAKLGKEEMGGETHVFSPAYLEEDFDEIVSVSDHIIFNSISQYGKFVPKVLEAGKSCGLRINPCFSTQEHGIYDPCSPLSRLGITRTNFPEELPEHVEGLHFHTLCEQDSADLESTLKAVEEQFGEYFDKIKWLNLGGGHHITKPGYDIERLIRIVKYLKEKYSFQVYLEPGEAIALNAGFLVAEVIDIIENGMKIAILNTSAACHMPDVLEMPYRPNVVYSGQPGEKVYTYRFGTNTCLAGDIIGDYSFDKELKVGDKLVFCDMAIYSMVKTNTFNGINLPSIYLSGSDGSLNLIRKFSYEDFKSRL